tara:strand:- start:5077 stop:5355 length:279 start_codon:yes stop_codon:yes gene_type:complete
MKNNQVENQRAFLQERIKSAKKHLESTVEQYVFNMDSYTNEECRVEMAIITSINISIFMYEKRLKLLDNPHEPMPNNRMTRLQKAIREKTND